MITKIEYFYIHTVRSKLLKIQKSKNIHNIPKLLAIVVNIGLNSFEDQKDLKNEKKINNAILELRTITCQHPVVQKAKKSVAGFKLREGTPTRVYVTLRRHKMFTFLEKFIHLTLPRVRDFNGFFRHSLDNQGNYSYGITDQFVFPEIPFDMINNLHGFCVTFVTSTKTKEDGKLLLEEIGIPFYK